MADEGLPSEGVPNPKTPSFPPEQLAALTLGACGMISQFFPISEDAKAGVVQVVTIIAPIVSVSGAAVRIGRQKWWLNFMSGDLDNDPSTPPTKIPVAIFVVTGVSILVALALAIALVVVLI